MALVEAALSVNASTRCHDAATLQVSAEGRRRPSLVSKDVWKPAQTTGGSETFPRRAYAIAALACTGIVTVHKFPFMAMSVGSVDGQWHLHAGDHRALPGDGQDQHIV